MVLFVRAPLEWSPKVAPLFYVIAIIYIELSTVRGLCLIIKETVGSARRKFCPKALAKAEGASLHEQPLLNEPQGIQMSDSLDQDGIDHSVVCGEGLFTAMHRSLDASSLGFNQHVDRRRSSI